MKSYKTKANMGNIDIISTCSITMASIDNKSFGISRVELTPWDLQLILLDPIQKGLLFSKPQSSSEKEEFETTFIDRLKASLARALDFFPPLTGRLSTTKNEDNTVCYFIDCNNAGAFFAHAIARDIYVRDILDPTIIVNSFFPLNGVSNHDGLSKPLLGVQVTELVDGFFVGCTMNHSVGDGTSFWHFLNSWSVISRGSDKISRLPVFDRSFPTENFPIRIPQFDLNTNEKISIPPKLERVFNFRKENISKLKGRANSEAGTDKISSLQAVLSHIWRAVTRCRVHDPDQEVSCFFIVGARMRLSLTDTYFGNAIHGATATAKARDLLTRGLGWAAFELNKIVSMQSEDEVKRVFYDWVKNPKFFNRKDNMFVNNKILISSSPRHNVYATDFGWGKPKAVRSGAAQKFDDGKMTMFPAAEPGGIDVEACLAPETLVALEADAEFMEAVSF